MLSFSDIWDKTVDVLSEEVSAVALSTWIKTLIPAKITSEKAVFQVHSAFQQEVICSRYLDLIKNAVSSVLGFEIDVEVVMEEEPLEPGGNMPIVPPEDLTDRGYDYTFDTFIVGNSNKFAHAAALAVSRNPATAYNPLFIYGGSGLGKTHLLYAIQHEIAKDFPAYKVVYLRGEEFTNELIDAIRHSKADEFRNKYRYADVLLLDDIQFIAGKESTQEEFFHTFNSLYSAKKQIILSSDRPPKEMSTLEDRLRTRFEWGLIADIQPPDFETRTAIIRRKAELLDMDMPEEVITFLATHLKTNIRQLEGAVKKIKAFHFLDAKPINLQNAQIAIRDILDETSIQPLTIEKIVDEVSAYYSISKEEITGKKRTAEIALARHMVMYLSRELTDLSLPAIGSKLGGRDHTTVIHGVRKIEVDTIQNPQTKKVVEELKKNLLGR